MGAPEKSLGNNSMQRVKVYRLNDDGKWDDQGTGQISVDIMDRSEDLGIFVIEEEDNEALLMHQIRREEIYRKQEDTIISWRDPEHSTELALSFQESAGCAYIWDQICSAQRNMHFNSMNNGAFQSMNSELRELPAVELSTLPLILKIVTESGIGDQMRLTEHILKDNDFFQKLMDIFKICEDLEDVDGLHMIFNIIKGIILLNNPQIFEKILGDELIMDIIGSLEYDPGVPRTQDHRKFLKEHVVFKEAIPIKDPQVLSKIHQTYRIGYLKDVVLPRVLDDPVVANLNSIIHANNAIVVSLLKDDSTFIQELFSRLRSPSTSAESEEDLVHFLHEFCSLSKSLQVVQQLRLFRDLINEGIFDIITNVLRSQSKKLVLTGTEILNLILNQDPNLLRSYVVRPEGIPLLGLLVKGMLTDFGEKMHCQFLEILRTLVDSYAQPRDDLIEIFYEKHLDQLVDVIATSCPESPSGSEGIHSRVRNHDIAKPEILSHICELLCFCVLHHPYRIKSSFLQNNVIGKVLFLTRRKEKSLVVAAIRFVRTLLSRHDDHLLNYIVKHNVLKPVIDVFVANGKRYNLLNSAVLEMFEYIRKGNIKPLLRYVVETFWNQLSEFENFPSIQAFKVKYEQCLENDEPKSNADVVESRKRVDERALDKEEEDYFNEDSDEEDTASASNTKKAQDVPHLSNGVASDRKSVSPRSGGLVDYEDDEDDENYKPPPRIQPEVPEEGEDTIESLTLKRKSPSRGREPEQPKKQRLGIKNLNKETVFAALRSRLSQAVSRNANTALATTTHSAEANKSSPVENHKEDATTTPATMSHSAEPNKSSSEENYKGDTTAAPALTEPNKSSPEEDYKGDESETSIKLSDKNEGSGEEVPASRKGSESNQGESDNGKVNREESSLMPPQSSPEMAVNGS